MKKPEYIFEISWEVCNMVGGIYTVIASKSKEMKNRFADHYITIGPDVWMETRKNPYFFEDTTLFPEWREQAMAQGLKIRIGRWNIESRPIAVLVDFTSLFVQKDTIFANLWKQFHLDSLYGQWDYVESALFGYAVGMTIQSFCEEKLMNESHVIAHFHEWMTGTGILYLKQHCPQIATVFTTHATYLGRCIAGNGLPLYEQLTQYNPTQMAKQFNIVSQQSLEHCAAHFADTFTTVSEITALECEQFLEKKPDVITINGIDNSWIQNESIRRKIRSYSRKKILEIASKAFGTQLPDDSFMLINSGRYELKNKGIDLFIRALGTMNKDENLDKKIVAIIAVPGNISGASKELLARINEQKNDDKPLEIPSTHYLFESEHDAVLRAFVENGLTNQPDSKVFVLFVPSYLNGNDGIFNITYYNFLQAFDFSIFPSYYEPWGYTPHESITHGIPTLTTDLAGFGKWIESRKQQTDAVFIAHRNETNADEVVAKIIESVKKLMPLTQKQWEEICTQAVLLATETDWKFLIKNYEHAWDEALQKAIGNTEYYNKRFTETLCTFNYNKQDQPNWKKLLVRPVYSKKLKKLQKISQNIWWCWNYEAIDLFRSINPYLWEKLEQNPIALMGSLSHKQTQAIENNPELNEKIDRVYSAFQAYMEEKPSSDDTIAYFSMEFGLMKSLKIYSGGLGILAGDYLKQASDSNANLFGVGLLYRYGYFKQDISVSGDQLAEYIPQKFSLLPLEPVRDENGEWITICIAFPGRNIVAKAWKVAVGRVNLYLLDTDVEENQPDDRSITYQLYGGDIEMRFKQEMILGIGGIRLIERLKEKPTIYHCNEGHAAFIGLERLRMYISENNFDFEMAKELVRASTLFTTHTPVPAGHDAFDEHLLRTYMPHYASRMNISWNQFMNFGRFRQDDPNDKFSMSVLATNLSQEVNGVSKIHGRVSREMFQPLYPGYFANELHIGYVTNGVHLPTWADEEWQKLYETNFGKDYIAHQSDVEIWKPIEQVPDETIWNIRKNLKSKLIDYLKIKIKEDLTARQESPKLILKTIESMNKDALIIGFARRFATYKRAHLLFTNLDRLSALVNNPEHPMIFLFAGKAHPNDKAGQDLIKMIVEISRRSEFIGKILFLGNYDMELGKYLTSSVDVWLNNPTRPLEASGTSGEKAVMNGVLNFSVLDGWWAEGYRPHAGWAIEEKRTYDDQHYQDELDAETIYNMFETEIIPLYFKRKENDIPSQWIQYIRNNIMQIAPNYTMKRMLDDYTNQYYNKLIERSKSLRKNNYQKTFEIVAWKNKIKTNWDNINVKSVKVPDPTIRPLDFGENFVAEITLEIPNLKAEDIGVELIFGKKLHDKIDEIVFVEKMNLIDAGEGWGLYYINVPIYRAGVYDYTFRIYPNNQELPHRQDFSLVKWI
ncbi:MAG: alpha-glucan family phosphorylase [Lentimicrobiaceae bacterium]|jgi:phosphorylase/glycogen(starch) synthase|nr:alpha-glucan family phosphorylase [Lentimicrobiaceae bacterium]